jgi:hypothetical protein
VILRPASSVMPRAANSDCRAAEVSGDGGTGVDSGMTKEISHASRTPRAVSSVILRNYPARSPPHNGDG